MAVATLPLHILTQAADRCCDRHTLAALDALNPAFIYGRHDHVELWARKLPGFDAYTVQCTNVTHGEVCTDMTCLFRCMDMTRNAMVAFQYLGPEFNEHAGTRFSVRLLPAAESRKPEHVRNWAEQDRALLNGVVKTCYWCRPSIFGLVAHHLGRGYQLPRSKKQIPHAMNSRSFSAAITRALKSKDYNAPDQTPFFGFDDHHRSDFENLCVAAMLRLGLTRGDSGDFDKCEHAYKTFVGTCGTTLEQATLDLVPTEAIAEETESLLRSNLNLVSLVTLGKPLEEVQETAAQTVQLDAYIVPSRQQRKQNKKKQ